MAHYAFLDDNNIVVKVIAGVDEDEKGNLPKEFDSWEAFYEDQQGMKCVRTSYNTKENQHSNEEKTAFRGNYAGIGNEYDPDDDIFYPFKPWDSWVKDKTTATWKAPKDKPDEENNYGWREDLGDWELIEPQEE